MTDTVHVHIWKPVNEHIGSDDDMLFDADVELVDEYDDYRQYGFEFEGKWIEIRVPKEG